MKDIAIVYLVAGLSSRFKGKIKQLIKVGPNNETLMEYSLSQALPAGFTKIVFVVGEKTEKPFKELFGNSYKGIPVEYAFQTFGPETRDKPWGTVDALCCSKDLINDGFVVLNSDDIYGEMAFKKLINHLKNNKNNATIGYKLSNVLPDKGQVNRGIFKIHPENTVESIKEVFKIEKSNLELKNLSNEDLCSMNIFGLTHEVLNLLNDSLTKFKEKNKGNRTIECLLPDELGKLLKQNKITMRIYSTNDQWFGVTNPEDEFTIKQVLKKQN